MFFESYHLGACSSQHHLKHFVTSEISGYTLLVVNKGRKQSGYCTLSHVIILLSSGSTWFERVRGTVHWSSLECYEMDICQLN